MAPLSPLAGKRAPTSLLVDVPRLVTAYFVAVPDPAVAAQRVAFGTSGHRGSAFDCAFNETHILAIAQAICLHRRRAGIDGPLFIGTDPHALSEPALASALEVFAANEVEAMIDAGGSYTPTPVISHAIIAYNRNRATGLADGIVITPSHNPPEDGGFKYNPPHGGPAGSDITGWIEATANGLIETRLAGVRRIPFARARAAACVHRFDYATPYVADLAAVIDMEVIRASGIRIGVDPLGGAAVGYWPAIIERYGIAATVVNDAIDPTFRFMTLDWDGRIRMDCSSPYAMASLVALRDAFDIAFATDTDADRHGIVCPGSGLMQPNDYLAAAIAYLCDHRPGWRGDSAIGKTIVSSFMIDRVVAARGRRLFEVPVGFKWFSAGLADGSLAFGGEESAGASFLRYDGTVWTTDKDGIILGLLAAEMTARTGKDPARLYHDATDEFGTSFYERIDAKADAAQKTILQRMTAADIATGTLGGEPIETIVTTAPGNGHSIGGIKLATQSGWFAARPSGTEDVYKIYAESARSQDHLRHIQRDAQMIVDRAIGAG